MNLAIMQPYFFPYIGYFQLIAAADKFVFYDDVNFIKNGWINRNRLVLAGTTRYITVPLAGASPFLKINQINLQDGEGWRRKLLESLRHSYSKAPYFDDVSALVQEVLVANEKISEVAKASLTAVCRHLGLEREFVSSSSIYGNDALSGQARVLDICSKEGATAYYNLPGGKDLYSEQDFARQNISLHFIQPRIEPYPQFTEQFQPGMSIIDVLMFNDRAKAKAMICSEIST
ncbi:WbqC family protein [Massilia sp. CT11-108]|uniref:WbqC family protein n=1 Tax=Massilia sp. CT11-108 TaxID=3393900 RepID=UPI0039A633EE